MPVDRNRIRVKSMLIAKSVDGVSHAVSVNAPTAENPRGYHRLIGGSVEVGETHRDAIEREVREELSAAIRELRYLGVVENIFRIDGTVGHEIVIIYAARPRTRAPRRHAHRERRKRRPGLASDR
ncbi:MAG: NUDIX domain-containing protein [Microbacterium sp.]